MKYKRNSGKLICTDDQLVISSSFNCLAYTKNSSFIVVWKPRKLQLHVSRRAQQRRQDRVARQQQNVEE